MPVILATDLIVYLVAGAALYMGYRGMRDKGAVFQEIKRNRLAAISMVLLSLYLGVALMDSVRWRAHAVNDNGSSITAKDGKAIYEGQALSLLDRVFSGLRKDTEKTYSAPFARRLFVKESMEGPGGKTVRGYPQLKHPGRHPLGTDKVGSDVLYTALKGVRTGIVIGTGTTIIVIPFAIFFGVIAGFFGGFVDDIIQYIYTTLSSIPGVLLIVAFMLLFGASGYQGGLISKSDIYLGLFVPNDRLFWLCLILGITSWTDLCRLIRGEAMKLRELEYVNAARAFGVPSAGIIWRHIVPNLMHIVLITMVLQFSGLVLAEAVLSYIGIGVGPEMGSWVI